MTERDFPFPGSDPELENPIEGVDWRTGQTSAWLYLPAVAIIVNSGQSAKEPIDVEDGSAGPRPPRIKSCGESKNLKRNGRVFRGQAFIGDGTLDPITMTEMKAFRLPLGTRFGPAA